MKNGLEKYTIIHSGKQNFANCHKNQQNRNTVHTGTIIGKRLQMNLGWIKSTIQTIVGIKVLKTTKFATD